MPDENRFFRFVWRFNALALAVVVLFALGIAGYDAWRRYHYHDADNPVGGFTPVPKIAEKDATYRLDTYSGFSLMVGEKKERLLSLKRWEGPPESYGLAMSMTVQMDSPAGMVGLGAVNLLVIDGATGKSHWMFSGYKRLILSAVLLYEDEQPALAFQNRDATPAAGAILRIIDKDTNGDGKLTPDDRLSLYVYLPGSQPVEFLSADTIVSMDHIGKDKFLIVYENGKSAFAATYDSTIFKLISREQLPNVPK